jgi:hypothetical protein
VLSFPAAKLSSALWPPAQQLAFRVWCKPQVPSKENKNVVLMGIKSDRDIKSINQSVSLSVSQPVCPSVYFAVLFSQCERATLKKKRGSLSKRMISEIAQQKGCIDPRLRA